MKYTIKYWLPAQTSADALTSSFDLPTPTATVHDLVKQYALPITGSHTWEIWDNAENMMIASNNQAMRPF
jgi:hypothetical protein